VAKVNLVEELSDPETLRSPYLLYARLRDAEPVYWCEPLRSWVLTRYDDCLAVLRDTAVFASDWRRVGERMPDSMLSIQTLDPPEHTRVRHFVVEAMRSVDRRGLESSIAALVRERVAAVRGVESVDFAGEFAGRLALDVICLVYGVPAPDLAWFMPVSQAIVDGMDAGVWPENHEPGVRARGRLAELAAGWLADPPPSGLVGHVAAGAARAGIDRDVLANSVRAMLHAGYESAGRLLGNAVAALLEHPYELRRLTSGVPQSAVEELVRFDPPVQADARACVADTWIGGRRIRRGEAVTLLLGAANRDPARFPEPDALDLTRDPNPHLGFGRGAHSCIGSALAVLLARTVLTVLAGECREIRMVADPVHHRNLTLRGLRSLDLHIE